MTTRGMRAASTVFVGVLLLVGLGVGGFAIGRADRTSKASVRAASNAAWTVAYRDADRAAFKASRRTGYAAGLTDGDRRAALVAGRAGTRAGVVAKQRAVAAAAAAATAVATQQSSSSTPACLPVGGGVCLAPGPGATGQPCPAGSVPNADGGVVCVPQNAIHQPNGGTPSVNSPQGQALLNSPSCQGTPPPPPGYTGPVQC